MHRANHFISTTRAGISLAASLAQETGLIHSHYQKAIILTSGRTGSTLLLDCLAVNPQMRVHQEICSDWYKQQQKFPYRYLLTNYPLVYLKLKVYRYYPGSVRSVVFKILYDHCQDNASRQIWNYLDKTEGIKIIHLKRNLLDVYVSYQLAVKYEMWHVREEDHLDYMNHARLQVNPQECFLFMAETSNNWLDFEKTFIEHEKYEIWYEDLIANLPFEMERIQNWLGVTPVPVQPRTYKQVNRPLEDIIENYAELLSYFQGTAWESCFQRRT